MIRLWKIILAIFNRKELKMGMLSANFSLAELTESQMAARNGIDNTPNAAQINALRVLATELLQPLRDRLGLPVRITSGFRCQAVNSLVGSHRASQHTRGEAADFKVTGLSNLDLAATIAEHLDFDQLILEFFDLENPTAGWVHCSYRATGNRRQILTASRDSNGKIWYQPGLPERPL